MVKNKVDLLNTQHNFMTTRTYYTKWLICVNLYCNFCSISFDLKKKKQFVSMQYTFYCLVIRVVYEQKMLISTTMTFPRLMLN